MVLFRGLPLFPQLLTGYPESTGLAELEPEVVVEELDLKMTGRQGLSLVLLPASWQSGAVVGPFFTYNASPPTPLAISKSIHLFPSYCLPTIKHGSVRLSIHRLRNAANSVDHKKLDERLELKCLPGRG